MGERGVGAFSAVGGGRLSDFPGRHLGLQYRASEQNPVEPICDDRLIKVSKEVFDRYRYAPEGQRGASKLWQRWQPASSMPKWAARIWLEIVSIRAERIQDISEGDAMVEGVSGHFDVVESGPHGATAVSDYRTGFKHMWTKIYGATGPKSWDANPWVWAISFKEVTK